MLWFKLTEYEYSLLLNTNLWFAVQEAPDFKKSDWALVVGPHDLLNDLYRQTNPTV